jgi:hypothetical protein
MRLLLGLFAGAWMRMRTRQAVPIARAPHHRLITVRGVVVPRDLIDSPLTGEPCVYYRYSVEDWRESRVLGGAGNGFWQLAEHDEAIVEFYVDDGTARAIVAPVDARVRAHRRLAEAAPEAAPGAVPGAVIDIHVQRRARQLLIEPGDEVEVTGVASEVADLHDESRDYRGGAQRLMLRAPEAGTLDIRILRKHAPLPV